MRRLLPKALRAMAWLLLVAIAVTAVLLSLRAPRLPLPNVSSANQGVSDEWAGRVAPDFELNTLGGRHVRLSDFHGRVVLVNFWATWCAPCRVEMPWLSDFADRYRAQGLIVLGVSVDDGGSARVASFVREQHVIYPILLRDPGVDARYGGVRFLPQTFFVGRNGNIIRRVYGVRSREDFEADIRNALASP